MEFEIEKAGNAWVRGAGSDGRGRGRGVPSWLTHRCFIVTSFIIPIRRQILEVRKYSNSIREIINLSWNVGEILVFLSDRIANVNTPQKANSCSV